MMRHDFHTIANWVKPGSKVLDLGCGDGSLLKFLQDTRQARGYGVELTDANILAGVKNGINIIQNDLESGLSVFESGSFDHVILSQTLQAMRHTEAILREMLRVGREGIVTFPNFGYWKNRLQVLRGNMPVSDDIPYQWYDTPNVHLCTMHDFEALCIKLGFHIRERVVMTAGTPVRFLPNLAGSLAVYRFGRVQ
ncbi:methionine biosynthesis protein MetW [Sulfuriferula plumbiphila]|uniref:Methionine biosynthesis protein MetW n=1 Tax=Sulfuriferula plumbiphila TaxID=171865 RepID=A0A512L3C9_9PROT|nr:methionine biosynthesis protein MetW [Sulfuriferula plumbiphila]BBP02682.1 methionine biosynthesis protein MetW [Sulfuriferula plumbiphila]GEP28976.1 methionine biosynthesis protein MetW [Sulfuriferula plumbiphila]